MNRRSFLRSVSIAAASGLILPEIAQELLAPKRTIFLPARLFGNEPTVTAIIGPPGLLSAEFVEREFRRADSRGLWFEYEIVRNGVVTFPYYGVVEPA